jgi:hypothetical protein
VITSRRGNLLAALVQQEDGTTAANPKAGKEHANAFEAKVSMEDPL